VSSLASPVTDRSGKVDKICRVEVKELVKYCLKFNFLKHLFQFILLIFHCVMVFEVVTVQTTVIRSQADSIR